MISVVRWFRISFFIISLKLLFFSTNFFFSKSCFLSWFRINSWCCFSIWQKRHFCRVSPPMTPCSHFLKIIFNLFNTVFKKPNIINNSNSRSHQEFSRNSKRESCVGFSMNKIKENREKMSNNTGNKTVLFDLIKIVKSASKSADKQNKIF